MFCCKERSKAEVVKSATCDFKLALTARFELQQYVFLHFQNIIQCLFLGFHSSKS